MHLLVTLSHSNHMPIALKISAERSNSASSPAKRLKWTGLCYLKQCLTPHQKGHPIYIYSNITFITLSSKSRSLSANDIWRTQVWISSHAAHPSPCLAKNSLRALHYCWPKARLFNPHVVRCREAKPSRSAKVGKGRLPPIPPLTSSTHMVVDGTPGHSIATVTCLVAWVYGSWQGRATRYLDAISQTHCRLFRSPPTTWKTCAAFICRHQQKKNTTKMSLSFN